MRGIAPQIEWSGLRHACRPRVHDRLAPDQGWAPVQLLREGRHEDCSPLQKAIDNAGYEYNLRKKELDYATRLRLP